MPACAADITAAEPPDFAVDVAANSTAMAPRSAQEVAVSTMVDSAQVDGRTCFHAAQAKTLRSPAIARWVTSWQLTVSHDMTSQNL